MDNASKNAGDMINALQLKYNRGRQAAITNELVDIITGAACVHPVSCLSLIRLSQVRARSERPGRLTIETSGLPSTCTRARDNHTLLRSRLPAAGSRARCMRNGTTGVRLYVELECVRHCNVRCGGGRVVNDGTFQALRAQPRRAVTRHSSSRSIRSADDDTWYGMIAYFTQGPRLGEVVLLVLGCYDGASGRQH
jgi:hypothetical protein